MPKGVKILTEKHSKIRVEYVDSEIFDKHFQIMY